MGEHTKTLYIKGTVDEGNWFHGQVTIGKSSGTIKFPLRALPESARRRARKGREVQIRMTLHDYIALEAAENRR